MNEEPIDNGERCIHCGGDLGGCDCPLEQGQFHPDNPVGEKPRKPHCPECGGEHEPSGSRSACIAYWRGLATLAISNVQWARTLLCSATPNSKYLDERHQLEWAKGFGKWFAESHTLPTLLHENGCARQIYDWLRRSPYRIVMHRHNHTFRAVDQSEKLHVGADTIPALADYLSGWPKCPEIKKL